MARVTEKLNFYFILINLNFNCGMSLVATMLDSVALQRRHAALLRVWTYGKMTIKSMF